MKRFLSLFLALLMVCSFSNISIFAASPGSSPSPIVSDGIADDMQEDDDSSSNTPGSSPSPIVSDGIANDMSKDDGSQSMQPSVDDDSSITSNGEADDMDDAESSNGFANDLEKSNDADEVADDFAGDTSTSDGVADDFEIYESDICRHDRIKEYFSEESCKKYDETKHELIGKYVIKCRECNEVLEQISGKKKELHDFDDGECEDCGYKAKDCEHEETEDIVTYWYNSVNERGNDASYVEYDIVCTYCDVKIDSKVHYGPVTAIRASSKCDHDDVEEIALMTYYEPSNEETHYMLTKYVVKCLECEEEFNNYTEEREYKHEIEDGKCTKCIYEAKKVSSDTSSKVNTNKESVKTETSKGNANSKYDKTDTSKANNSTNTAQKENSQNVVSKETSEKTSSSSDENKVTEPVESFFIRLDAEHYAVNDTRIAWKSIPCEINGTLQVPLREFAEQMGWKVTWDSTNRYAYVDDGKTIKTFIADDIICVIDSGETMVGKRMTNKNQIVDGILYADLDGLLEETGYAYYISDTTYRIGVREEIINRVAIDKLTGYNKLTAPKNLYDDADYLAALEENRVIYASQQGEDSTYYAIIKPMADQAVYGNYYEGDTTMEGVVCRIIVGELPGAGTASDFRDVVADFQNWDGTWSHAGNTLLDIIGIVPLLGSLKYADELALAAKNADDITDVAKKIDKVTDVSKNADNAADATGSITHVDELVDSANKTGNVADVTKNADEALVAAKASIKSVDDLKKLTKHPEIYAEDTIKHIFYGNSKGGFHYKGLSGANGSIDEITGVPNEFGVYSAKVKVCGKTKTNHTFFPDDWTPEEVIDAIEDAYANGTYDSAKNIKEYTMKSGMKIQVNLDRKTGEIVSAFPLYD